MAEDRASTLAAVDGAYATFHDLLRGLDGAEGMRAAVVGQWSAAQTLAHMVGWLGEGREALERMARGERPTPAGTDYSNTDAWNAKFVEVHTTASWEEALPAFERSFAGLRAALAAMPEERFGAGRTVNTIAFNACLEHFGEHEAQIAQALGR